MIDVIHSHARLCRASLIPALVITAVLSATASAQQQPAGGLPASAQGTIHVVEKGDTLWDLAERYMNNPREWPAIYEANNKIIADPHWIYPGQRIWFPAGGGSPIILSFAEVWPESKMSVTQAAQRVIPLRFEVELETGPPETGPPETGPPETDPLETVPSGTDTSLVTVMVRTAERIYQPLASVSAILAAGYIGDPREWSRGEIMRGESGDTNMSIYSQVFIDIGDQDVDVGDTYIVVDQRSRVRHPVLGYRMGWKIKVKGVIRIVDVETGTSQGVMVSVFDAIHSGNRVIPAPEVDSRPWKEFIPVQGGRSGFVVARAQADGNMHPYDMLFIDGGREEGVRMGDLYVLKRPQTEQGRLRFYEQELGRAVVIAVQEKTATLMMLSLTSSDIAAGEKVELIGRSVFVESIDPGR